MKFCSKCGIEMPDDAMFCGECGQRFSPDLKQREQQPTQIQQAQFQTADTNAPAAVRLCQINRTFSQLKKYSKTFLCISISSFALGVISLVFSLVHYKNRPSAAVYSVTRAYRGIRAAQQEEFTYQIITVIFLIIGIVLILGGIIFLVLHFKKKKTSLQLNSVNGTFNNSIYKFYLPNLFCKQQ